VVTYPLKAELHAHSAEDPFDLIPYDARTLIDRAAALGYTALAVTLHDRQLDIRDLVPYGRERGVVLIRGIERTIRGKHVLLLNFPDAAEQVASFDDVRRLKARSNGLVVAPHPFFPTSTCLGRALDEYPDLFDAIEVNAFYTKRIDFNRRGISWARRHGKPLVANADVHRLRQLGKTYSMVDAEPHADAVCEAIRDGRVSVVTEPISAVEAASHLADLAVSDAYKTLRRFLDQRGDRPDEAGREDRLRDVQRVPRLGDALAVVGGRGSAHGDGRQRVSAGARVSQQLQPVASGHADVAHEYIERRGPKAFERRVG
jgi:predicted metal-dependent phosphoesterase TrpH